MKTQRTPAAKVRRTDYRPQGNAGTAGTGLERSATAREAEAREHDRAVAILTPETLRAAAADLGRRRCWDYRDPEQRWCLGRLAALARRIDRDGRF